MRELGSYKAIIRMPEDLRDRLKNEAANNHRTMTMEVIHRLENSFTPGGVNKYDTLKEMVEKDGLSGVFALLAAVCGEKEIVDGSFVHGDAADTLVNLAYTYKERGV